MSRVSLDEMLEITKSVLEELVPKKAAVILDRIARGVRDLGLIPLERCPTCNGAGRIHIGLVTDSCGDCHGNGQVRKRS